MVFRIFTITHSSAEDCFEVFRCGVCRGVRLTAGVFLAALLRVGTFMATGILIPGVRFRLALVCRFGGVFGVVGGSSICSTSSSISSFPVSPSSTEYFLYTRCLASSVVVLESIFSIFALRVDVTFTGVTFIASVHFDSDGDGFVVTFAFWLPVFAAFVGCSVVTFFFVAGGGGGASNLLFLETGSATGSTGSTSSPFCRLKQW